MSTQWGFAAKRVTSVRAYSIGPHSLDWLCVYCGHVGCHEEIGPFAPPFKVQASIAANEQMRVYKALSEGRSHESVEELGALVLEVNAERACFEHLQRHVRFEDIDRTNFESNA